jgi:hypothetical protein
VGFGAPERLEGELDEPLGKLKYDRVCVPDPEGVWVELFDEPDVDTPVEVEVPGTTVCIGVVILKLISLVH